MFFGDHWHPSILIFTNKRHVLPTFFLFEVELPSQPFVFLIVFNLRMSGGATGGLGSGVLLTNLGCVGRKSNLCLIRIISPKPWQVLKGSSLFAAMAAACALHVLVHLTVSLGIAIFFDIFFGVCFF